MFPGTLGQNGVVFDRFLNNFLHYKSKDLPPELRKEILPPTFRIPIDGTTPTFGGTPDSANSPPLVLADQSKVLDNSTLHELIVRTDDWLIEFYTPW